MLFLTCANVEPPHAKAHSAQTVSRKSAVCTRRLTEKRTLQPIPHRKAHSVPAMPPRRDGKAHSAQHGSRRVRLSVRRRGRMRPSAGPRATPAPSPRGLGDRHARAVAHGSPQPGAGPRGRRRLGSVSSGLRKCRGVRVMLSGYPEAGGSDAGDPEAGNPENLPTQPEDKDPVGCRHTPRL